MNEPNPYKEEKTASLLKNLAADFIQKESSRTSLITITRVILFDKLQKATVLFTVLPESMENDVLEFTTRRAGDFRSYVREHAKIGTLPHFSFKIDKGEKNRQNLDKIK